MSKKAKPLNVLYIEDNVDDYKRLQMVANTYRIILDHALSFEEGVKKYEEKGEIYYDGIILDALCLIKQDDSIPRKEHVGKAYNYFNNNAKSLLSVIYTGETAYAKTIEEVFGEELIPIFNKGSDEETNKMLIMIVNASKQKEVRVFASRNPEVFEVFDKGYMDQEALEEILGCLRDMQSSDFTLIKNNLACLRRLQEKVYIALNRIDPAVVPDEFMKPDNFVGSKVQVRAIYKYLTERGYVKRYSIIDTYASSLYSITSDNGSHTPYENPDFRPTKYTVQAMIFAMLDLLLWFKKIAEEKIP